MVSQLNRNSRANQLTFSASLELKTIFYNMDSIPIDVTASFAYLANCGPLRSQRRMRGMSQGVVYLLEFDDFTLVAKHLSSERELIFYRSFAGPLRTQNLLIPHLYEHQRVGNDSWVLLEFVRDALPKQEWNSIRVLSYLSRLHNLEHDFDHSQFERPCWTSEKNQQALNFFPSHTRDLLFQALEKLRDHSSHLFSASYLSSGDCNINNWRMNETGELVLLDWERFTLASPAIDLATLVPGYPKKLVFDGLAYRYLRVNPLYDASPAQLSLDIMAAVAWITVDILSLQSQGKVHLPSKLLSYLAEFFPQWLESIRSFKLS